MNGSAVMIIVYSVCGMTVRLKDSRRRGWCLFIDSRTQALSRCFTAYGSTRCTQQVVLELND